MPDLRDHFTHRPADLFGSDIWPILIRDYLPQMTILGDRRITRTPHKTAENSGKPIAVWRDPISDPNRGWGCPIFGIILALPSRTCFCADIWPIRTRD